jgi:hypothetical protein
MENRMIEQLNTRTLIDAYQNEPFLRNMVKETPENKRISEIF